MRKTDSTAEVLEWLNSQKLQATYKVSQVLLTELLKWNFNKETNELFHETGGFFSVKGLSVKNSAFAKKEVNQPILNQPEKGILGFIRTILRDRNYYLVQAKFEPGNPDFIQISPTVQATLSNYSQLHGGIKTKYIEYFLHPNRFSFSRFSKYELTETASRFLEKTNYNCVIDLPIEDIEFHENFILIEENCLKKLMRIDNIINMNARSILSIAFNTDKPPQKSLEIESWLNNLRKIYPTCRVFKTIEELKDWKSSNQEIMSSTETGFSIIGIKVKANREVGEWFQPILKNKNLGICTLFIGVVGNETKYLIQAYPEVGTLKDWSIGPTIFKLDESSQLRAFFRIDDESIYKEFRYSVRHSEEGGRFYNNINEYSFYNVDPKQIKVSNLYRWVSFAELISLNEVKGAVTSELRTMIAILSSDTS